MNAKIGQQEETVKSDGLTRNELVEAMQSLGNHHVIWSGRSGLTKDAVGDAVLTRGLHGDTPLISLEPARTQSNVGDAPTTADVLKAREELRTVKSQFASAFESYSEGEITKRNFVHIKSEYDAAIDRVIEVLDMF